jgi:hypothetical protein
MGMRIMAFFLDYPRERMGVLNGRMRLSEARKRGCLRKQ